MPKISVCLAVLMIRSYIVTVAPDFRLLLHTTALATKHQAGDCDQQASAKGIERQLQRAGPEGESHDMAARRNADRPKSNVGFENSRWNSIDVRPPSWVIGIAQKKNAAALGFSSDLNTIALVLDQPRAGEGVLAFTRRCTSR